MQAQLFNFDDSGDFDEWYGICAYCLNRYTCSDYKVFEIPDDTSVCFQKSLNTCNECVHLTNSDEERGMCQEHDECTWVKTYACESFSCTDVMNQAVE